MFGMMGQIFSTLDRRGKKGGKGGEERKGGKEKGEVEKAEAGLTFFTRLYAV